ERRDGVGGKRMEGGGGGDEWRVGVDDGGERWDEVGGKRRE
ncbi:hypothetical protein A2U01_0113172, partial [Trifolium medium]|nr:hypothetical protein [Trifolium medium]